MKFIHFSLVFSIPAAAAYVITTPPTPSFTTLTTRRTSPSSRRTLRTTSPSSSSLSSTFTRQTSPTSSSHHTCGCSCHSCVSNRGCTCVSCTSVAKCRCRSCLGSSSSLRMSMSSVEDTDASVTTQVDEDDQVDSGSYNEVEVDVDVDVGDAGIPSYTVMEDGNGDSESHEEQLQSSIPFATDEITNMIPEPEEQQQPTNPLRTPSLKKRKPKPGKPLSTCEIGMEVVGVVKTVTGYGAFIDIGFQNDGLLHISRISNDYVSCIGDLIRIGDEVTVRVVGVDLGKGQVSLTMRSREEEERAEEEGQQRRAGKERRMGDGNGRVTNNGITPQMKYATTMALVNSPWDSAKFFPGTIVSTLSFGAFIRFNAADVVDGLTGQLDGLCHISALSVDRLDDIEDFCIRGDVVSCRIKAIESEGGRVSLSLIRPEDERSKPMSMAMDGGGGGRERKAPERFTEEEMGAKDWRESLGAFEQPAFSNTMQ